METKPRETPSYVEAKDMLPPELHAHFDELLKDYRFAALKRHGKEWASPTVIAELVLLGWRSSAEPAPRNEDSKKSLPAQSNNKVRTR
jgi:hypothetical protein